MKHTLENCAKLLGLMAKYSYDRAVECEKNGLHIVVPRHKAFMEAYNNAHMMLSDEDYFNKVAGIMEEELETDGWLEK